MFRCYKLAHADPVTGLFQQKRAECIGGDLRVAGQAPDAGWHIGIVTSARTHALDEVHETVALHTGAIASSSTAVRRWQRGSTSVHHIVDPFSGQSATEVFTLVTVVAPTCVEANALSTASLVWGEEALFELPQRADAARLVRREGAVERVGAWPTTEEVSS